MKSLKPVLLLALLMLGAPFAAQAQTSVAEDFTGTSTSNAWWFFNGACLTAGSAAGIEPTATSAGQMPGCTAIGVGSPSPYYNENLVGGYNGVAGAAQTLPDPVGHGALRFTNGSPGGFSQNGGILSTTPFSTGQGVSVTFKTITYRGNSGSIGAGFTFNDGADGISFFLMDSSQLNTSTITGVANGDGNGLGSWGGSLGYSCSNSNPPYNGLIGAYVGLGIDEYGNFLNGVNLVTGYAGTNTASGDNSQYGYGRRPNRIGLRGAGYIAWNWLHTTYPLVYPNSLTAAQQKTAVQQTCQNGVVWDTVNNRASDANGHRVDGSHPAVPLYDYAPITNAYSELPLTTKIANEAAMNRGAATPIFYQLKITQSGKLSLSYSINGGAYQNVITSQSITASNGPLPANFLFGFAGSTGGSTNIHEILCFRADPATTAASSAGASEKQATKIETGAQAYFAYYNPANWTGRVTASGLGLDSFGNVIVAATPNWDASCVLTGVASGKTCTTTLAAGPIAAQGPTARTILTWNGSQGIPFQYASLTSSPSGGQQAIITSGDVSTQNCNATTAYAANDRVAYLRGDRTCEINSSGVGLFRARQSVLADVVDSSPTWVGPPDAPYTGPWRDRLYPTTASIPESGTGAQTYAQYITAYQTRLNVVYVGADDGLLHGFRTGSYDTNGNYVSNASTPNDGREVLAYMPGSTLNGGAANPIHSATANVDYSNAQYGHQFYVDATPAVGDLFYGNAWHTWLVGGLGAGGADIFALDVTNPTTGNFAESNAASLVKGDWTPSTISCTNVANCGNNLGSTYGTPQIRRLHNGTWAVLFGNGFGSATGDAGLFIMTVDPSTAAKTFYYLSTGVGSSASPNGIAYVAAADLDADHVADYVYAGDMQGNVWRFDLTSTSPTNWALTPGPLFTTPSGQPITTQLVIAGGAAMPGMQPQVMVLFGTGQKTPLSNTSPATYAANGQSLYGIWDWNMAGWNAVSGAAYSSLAGSATGLSGGNHTIAKANLQGQTVNVGSSGDVEIQTNSVVCWQGLTLCGSNNNKFGWYINLPGTQEQIVFNPELIAQAFTVNSIVPAANNPIACTVNADTGFTYVVSAMTGGAFNQVFFPPGQTGNSTISNNPAFTDAHAIAMQTNATGSSFVVYNNSGVPYLVFQTTTPGSGSGGGGGGNGNGTNYPGLNLPPNTSGKRLSWIERR